MRISDWSSDVCSSDLDRARCEPGLHPNGACHRNRSGGATTACDCSDRGAHHVDGADVARPTGDLGANVPVIGEKERYPGATDKGCGGVRGRLQYIWWIARLKVRLTGDTLIVPAKESGRAIRSEEH